MIKLSKTLESKTVKVVGSDSNKIPFTKFIMKFSFLTAMLILAFVASNEKTMFDIISYKCHVVRVADFCTKFEASSSFFHGRILFTLVNVLTSAAFLTLFGSLAYAGFSVVRKMVNLVKNRRLRKAKKYEAISVFNLTETITALHSGRVFKVVTAFIACIVVANIAAALLCDFSPFYHQMVTMSAAVGGVK
jgi:hypothetical protein